MQLLEGAHFCRSNSKKLFHTNVKVCLKMFQLSDCFFALCPIPRNFAITLFSNYSLMYSVKINKTDCQKSVHLFENAKIRKKC